MFLERRAYKRKVKKYLSKDILAENLRDEMVSKIIGGKKAEDPLGYLGKLLGESESTISTDTNGSSIFEEAILKKAYSPDTSDIFSSLIEKIGESVVKIINNPSVMEEP